MEQNNLDLNYCFISNSSHGSCSTRLTNKLSFKFVQRCQLQPPGFIIQSCQMDKYTFLNVILISRADNYPLPDRSGTDHWKWPPVVKNS